MHCHPRRFSDANNPAYYSGSVASGRASDMAVQHGLGILSERWLGFGPCGRVTPGRDGTALRKHDNYELVRSVLRRQRALQRVRRFACPAAAVRVRIIAQLVPRNVFVLFKRIHRDAIIPAAALQMSMR